MSIAVNPNVSPKAELAWGSLVTGFIGREVRYIANPWSIGTGLCIVASIASAIAIIVLLGAPGAAIAAMTSITFGGVGVFFLIRARRAEQGRELYAHLEWFSNALTKSNIEGGDKAIGFINDFKDSYESQINGIKENFKLIKKNEGDQIKITKSLQTQITDFRKQLYSTSVGESAFEYVKGQYE